MPPCLPPPARRPGRPPGNRSTLASGASSGTDSRRAGATFAFNSAFSASVSVSRRLLRPRQRKRLSLHVPVHRRGGPLACRYGVDHVCRACALRPLPRIRPRRSVAPVAGSVFIVPSSDTDTPRPAAKEVCGALAEGRYRHLHGQLNSRALPPAAGACGRLRRARQAPCARTRSPKASPSSAMNRTGAARYSSSIPSAAGGPPLLRLLRASPLAVRR